MQPSTSTILSVISTDPLAAEFLLSLFCAAAFSTRFVSLLPSLPSPYLDSAAQQPNIALLRADLVSLAPLHSLHPPISPRLKILLAYFLFHPNSDTPFLSTAHTHPQTHIPSSELSSHRVARRFLLNYPSPVRAFPSHVPAFHGSAPENWHSILRHGLNVLPEQFGASHGRIFGDALYLSASFPLAMSFAPHNPVPPIPACRTILSASVIGEFHLTQNAALTANAIPEEYLVVTDVSRVRLHALCVLVELRRATALTDRCPPLAVQWLTRRVGAVWLIFLSYAILLLWIAAR